MRKRSVGYGGTSLILLGQVVTLRPLAEGDLELLRQWANDPDLRSKVVDWSPPVSAEEQRRWFEAAREDSSTRRYIIQRSQGERVGMAGLWKIDLQARSAELGLKIGLPAARSRGLGTDTVQTLVRLAFEELELHRLWARILANNVSSLRLFIEKCGWKEEGRLRQAAFRDGAHIDVVMVALLREESLYAGKKPSSWS